MIKERFSQAHRSGRIFQETYMNDKRLLRTLDLVSGRELCRTAAT